MSLTLVDLERATRSSLPSIDEWLDIRYADQRRAIEFKREFHLDKKLFCLLWIHNYKGMTLHAKASAENSGDAFREALRLIEQGMQ